ncbi:PREDICTED: proline-rich receptor-like protein kinase PERK10 isoform X1 [Branchiostoma belcheri]|uniref:Proline-rich receptor-like protein kinase PERK10 isoform X1 n=1 Tax=Branchiostoma belcheri TaxID=7741 RepID=A0A6P4XYA8_BRABE|nr:PREDICTED: proline-rich receptor-like protein kinase PERK10 isoform X1 [Branchiostoma belcheri]XP_019621631.1 PREDICTED: proline-rich receptor-like protein kinase PERK10 isoform X1 [Branchiostoma belcheri]
MRMSLEGAERRVQHRVVQQNHNAQVPAAEQTDSTALDLTTKPKRNTDEAPVDLRRKSTSPDTTGPAPRAERATISPRNSQSSDRQVPAAAAPPSQFPVIPQRHVQAAVMPRVPPPLIQVRPKPSQASDGKLQVESRQSTNVHPTAQQRMSHTQTFPAYQGEEMQSFVARHPNPPTLIASPNVQHLLPPPVGAKASPAYQGEEMKSFVARHRNPPTLIASPNVQHLLPPPVGAKASPAYQGEEMKSFVARHPNPPTIIASPNVQHLLPPPVGAKASPCPTQTTTSNPRQRYILPKQGKPSEEKSTVSCLNNAPKDTSDVTPARYYRLGRVPEYMRGGAWHPNQPTTVECTVPDQSITVDHTVSNQPTTVEYTITNQPTTMQCTTKKQSITVEPTVPNQPITMENTEPNQSTTMEQTVASQPMTVDLTGPEEGLEKEQPRRLSMVEWARTFAIYATAKQQEKKMKPTPRKRGPKPRTNRQNKPQKRHDHMREIELEQRQNQGEQVAQQQQQQQEEEELHKRQAEQNKQSQENDTEEQSQARSNSHQEQDQEQKNSEATLCQDAGSKLWWERLQELMATMGERQKQDPGFAQKVVRELVPDAKH